MTSQFCTSLARKLECYVIAGYPESLEEHERGQREDGTHIVGANSAVLVGPNGESFAYRKSNLFETDKTWSKPGTNSVIRLTHVLAFYQTVVRRRVSNFYITQIASGFTGLKRCNMHGSKPVSLEAVDSRWRAL